MSGKVIAVVTAIRQIQSIHMVCSVVALYVAVCLCKFTHCYWCQVIAVISLNTNVEQVVVTMGAHSIVEFSLDHNGYSCGYCHSSSTSYSHGLCYSVTVILIYVSFVHPYSFDASNTN